MAKYTTIIFNKERKNKFDEFKRNYMLKHKIFKLSDAEYCLKLAELYDSTNKQ